MRNSFSPRLTFVTYSPEELATIIYQNYHSSEYGWHTYFGESWEIPYKALSLLPQNATEKQIFTALGKNFTPHLAFLHCASCTYFSTTFLNLGRVNATFLICERCAEEAKDMFEKRNET